MSLNLKEFANSLGLQHRLVKNYLHFSLTQCFAPRTNSSNSFTFIILSSSMALRNISITLSSFEGEVIVEINSPKFPPSAFQSNCFLLSWVKNYPKSWIFNTKNSNPHKTSGQDDLKPTKDTFLYKINEICIPCAYHQSTWRLCHRSCCPPD